MLGTSAETRRLHRSLAGGERVRVWAKGEGHSRQKALHTERWLESGAEVGKDPGPDPAGPHDGEGNRPCLGRLSPRSRSFLACVMSSRFSDLLRPSLSKVELEIPTHTFHGFSGLIRWLESLECSMNARSLGCSSQKHGLCLLSPPPFLPEQFKTESASLRGELEGKVARTGVSMRVSVPLPASGQIPPPTACATLFPNDSLYFRDSPQVPYPELSTVIEGHFPVRA